LAGWLNLYSRIRALRRIGLSPAPRADLSLMRKSAGVMEHWYNEIPYYKHQIPGFQVSSFTFVVVLLTPET
jgi:hypothetical protein